MNTFDQNIDLSFLMGREVVQIAIGIYQVIFAFDEDVTISVEEHFRYACQTATSDWRPGANHAAAATVDLLGTTVKSVSRSEENTLDLRFSNGASLTIISENKGPESYQITARGTIIVV